jgi:hypothetical protein
MLIFGRTYGMRCVSCGQVVPCGTPISVNSAGEDFVEHRECAVTRIVEQAWAAGRKVFDRKLEELEKDDA